MKSLAHPDSPLKTDGHSMHYLENENEEKTLILLLYGLIRDSVVTKKVFTALSF
jgi:hypothetical protein